MTRNIGAELAARMTHLNEMLANGESVGAISRADVDIPQPVAKRETDSPEAVEMPHASHHRKDVNAQVQDVQGSGTVCGKGR